MQNTIKVGLLHLDFLLYFEMCLLAIRSYELKKGGKRKKMILKSTLKWDVTAVSIIPLKYTYRYISLIITLLNPTKSYRNSPKHAARVVAQLPYILSIATERLTCLNNDCGVQLGTHLARGRSQVRGPGPRGRAVPAFFFSTLLSFLLTPFLTTPVVG